MIVDCSSVRECRLSDLHSREDLHIPAPVAVDLLKPRNNLGSCYRGVLPLGEVEGQPIALVMRSRLVSFAERGENALPLSSMTKKRWEWARATATLLRGIHPFYPLPCASDARYSGFADGGASSPTTAPSPGPVCGNVS